MLKNSIWFLLILSIFVASCKKDNENPSPKEKTESLLLGEWYTGPSEKYYYSGDSVSSTQKLPAREHLVIYYENGTTFHAGHNLTEPYEVHADGSEIVIGRGTDKERYYQIQRLTQDSLVVYGPFNSYGEFLEPNIAYTHIMYRTKSSDPTPKEVTEGLIIGDWYSGAGTKYYYSGDTQTGTQELAADNILIVYRKDGTIYHDGRNTFEPFEISSDGKEVLISKNESTERVYQIQKLTSDSLVVYGPFTRTGEFYEEGVLYTLTHYKK